MPQPEPILGSRPTTQRGHELALIAYREQNGKFHSLDDLRKVPNIEFKRIQLKKDAIRY